MKAQPPGARGGADRESTWRRDVVPEGQGRRSPAGCPRPGEEEAGGRSSHRPLHTTGVRRRREKALGSEIDHIHLNLSFF